MSALLLQHLVPSASWVFLQHSSSATGSGSTLTVSVAFTLLAAAITEFSPMSFLARVPQFRHRYFHHLESQYESRYVGHLFIGTPMVMLDTEMLSREISLRSRVTSCFRFSVFFPCTNHSSVLQTISQSELSIHLLLRLELHLHQPPLQKMYFVAHRNGSQLVRFLVKVDHINIVLHDGRDDKYLFRWSFANKFDTDFLLNLF